ncbi:methylenetetrahydrofolate reductase [NAD(P)H] [Acidithiobacillus thiooxidans]|uniref:Methylenetetrahydrofolate reductase n=1 Tax=Acidithiobacillus thiooxidans ATCC 19377 TaxID=637390 RepID=A0A543Q524_ACITH|nr:methylenetetrahydrofolate reductase [NAD(P)H] [Acidithiobacillus thiooxidans]MDR7926920.1 methylenetetrahydrofolate reductase [NAD(P)H] [Acidithiobacillus thiooxidans]MDX5934464.1 methylenetetrahydrofolate reductase [NAD(P)H] [Acidithiobacillus thiooxidans]TQN51421.1 5,10-methylenetetrahydrofolate reductase [Acidithiobacillus thiooxidans ATCC 19377]
MAHSVEFFPPKNAAGEQRLQEAIRALLPLKPEYASVTFGAGGSTRERTFATVDMIRKDYALEAVPHLSCIGSTESGIQEILEDYRTQGIQRIVALRGDLPEGMSNPGHFEYAADLVGFIRQFGGFKIYVAGYPEVHPKAVSAEEDLQHLVEKVQAGADAVITQYFYNPDAYLQLRDDLQRRGVEVPIVVGVMPITNFEQISRFSAMCGAELPQYLRRRMEAYGEDLQSQYQFGIELLSRQCETLLAQGAPSLHFYTLNQSEATTAIWQNLGL